VPSQICTHNLGLANGNLGATAEAADHQIESFNGMESGTGFLEHTVRSADKKS
jgi:hypothetical protein